MIIGEIDLYEVTRRSRWSFMFRHYSWTVRVYYWPWFFSFFFFFRKAFKHSLHEAFIFLHYLSTPHKKRSSGSVRLPHLSVQVINENVHGVERQLVCPYPWWHFEKETSVTLRVNDLVIKEDSNNSLMLSLKSRWSRSQPASKGIDSHGPLWLQGAMRIYAYCKG